MGNAVAQRAVLGTHVTARFPSFGVSARLCPAVIVAFCSVSAACPARAQESVLIAPPQTDFDRGRNVSVTQRSRPEYDPLGINIGSFRMVSQIETSLGVTSNVYLRGLSNESDGYVVVRPSINIASNWSRNSVRLRASTQSVRFFEQTSRNQNEVDLGAVARLEVGSDYALTGEGQYSIQYESPLTGEVNSDLAVISRYDRRYLALRGERSVGNTRLQLALDNTVFAFSPIRLSGATIDQDNRNRRVTRATGQFFYALSPSFAVYSQLTHDWIDYETELEPGVANRDSEGDRILGGISFDLSSLARGSVGIGYNWRRYNSSLYNNVGGFSVEGRVEFFPTELTTVTVSARRLITDASIGRVAASFDNRLSFRVDHELLYNVLLTGTAEVAYIDYLETDNSSTVTRFAASGRYLANRELRFGASIAYSNRENSGTAIGAGFDEFTGLISIIIQR